jgi:putative colanic acid biosynthesis UDP-glucose lipid carrier transferase
MRISPAVGIAVLLDPVIFVAAFLISGFVQGVKPGLPELEMSVFLFFLAIPGGLQLADEYLPMARKAMVHWVIVVILLSALGKTTGLVEFFERRVLLGWVILVPILMLLGRFVVLRLLPEIIACGKLHSSVIVGFNNTGVSLSEQFTKCPWLGVRVEGFFDDRAVDRQNEIRRFNLLGSIEQLASYVKAHQIERIYIALPMTSQPRILKLLDDLRDTTASTYFVPDIFITDLIQGRMDIVNGIPVFSVCESPFVGLNGFIKRGSDIVITTAILLLVSPLMIACAIAVSASSPGPILFRQRRYGLDGREIVIYKFRSMTVCEDGLQVSQAKRNDVRLTPVGLFLRRTSLDELPQFLNVLQGRMSIVGPRPHAVSHNEQYRKLIKGYMTRHKVRPGITGWAQVHGLRGETKTLDKMSKRIEFDLDYLRNWSLSLDIWIILKTIRLVIKDSNAY